MIEADMNEVPKISVILPTLGRPDEVSQCLRCLQSIDYPKWELIIVDQSRDNRTGQIVAAFSSTLPNLKYLRIDSKGLSRSRNIGIDNSSGDIIAFIDDDCTIEPDWLEQIKEVFARNPSAALVFGCLVPVLHDHKMVWIPGTSFVSETILRGKQSCLDFPGAGGAMYLNTRIARGVGRFDELIGPGTMPFGLGDDTDFGMRALLAGHEIVVTPHIQVAHHGARSIASGASRRYITNAMMSGGAICMKFLRCGEFFALELIKHDVISAMRQVKWRWIVTGKRPTKIASLGMYLLGLIMSYSYAVDREARVFRIK